MPQNETASLYFKDSRSDKVYHAQLTEKDTGFLVTFQYGRRGSSLTTGAKTKLPIDYTTAKKTFDTLIKTKRSKGYTPGADETAYSDPELAARVTGILPQLLNPIDEDQLIKCLTDDKYCCQEKFDGERGLIKKDLEAIIGINRKGLSKPLSSTIYNAIAKYKVVDSVTLDGEMFGDYIKVFDILEGHGVNLIDTPYSNRLKLLEAYVENCDKKHIQLVYTAFTTKDKQALYNKVKKANGEGVVFKKLNASYVPGRPNSGGTQLKYKFYATASCIVNTVHTTKRSIGLGMWSPRGNLPVGNCTIPANHAIPEEGQVVEIKYLYAYEGGSLYQPIYLGVRTDIDKNECVLSQLKLKPE